MTSKWWQIGLSAEGRKTLFTNEEARRQALHRVAAAAPDETLLFGIIDDHLHHAVACSERQAGNCEKARVAVGEIWTRL